MNSYKASIGNVMYVYQNKLTNLHLLFNCYRKEKMHRQLQRHIESHLKSIYYGCAALFVSNYDVIPKVTSPDSNLVQMLLHKTVKQAVDDPIDEMINAISLKNSEQFETALIKRIKEIRRFDIDHFLCMDIWSMGLIKEAKKNGLHFHSDYIEVDCKDC